ncbi:lysophospholipid acyltransferase family protein [Hufsiella ginkgonis]|uniref:Glycerol acyltransferase n=1 Tax=Hufsiella ginkgonis TaxID=2695274 RepID=A0A7K1XUR6_9SPHI|nr:lysophospholipid acyltransferase family protein [Hufsiella ginkgonis]MXV14751.1 glycerol acyltransferase [Hufsiella ginkgonis]
MLSPRTNNLVYTFFSWYISRIIRSDFHQVVFKEITLEPGRAVLLLANHSSWWDAFVIFHLNKKFLHKKFHVMVTEENHRKVWFFKYLGAFSVKKRSRDLLTSLEFAARLLDDPENLVLIFPQGKLHSGHAHHIRFEKGLLQLVSRSAANFQYLFASLFVDYFQHRKPSVTCYLEQWMPATETSLALINDAYNKHYENARLQQAKITV